MAAETSQWRTNVTWLIVMDGRTLIEKILSRKAGKAVSAGQIADVEPDLVVTQDSTDTILQTFDRIGGNSIFDSSKIAIALDNVAPAPTVRLAQVHKTIRMFVCDKGIQHFFDVGNDICHQVLPEAGLISSGIVVVTVRSLVKGVNRRPGS